MKKTRETPPSVSLSSVPSRAWAAFFSKAVSRLACVHRPLGSQAPENVFVELSHILLQQGKGLVHGLALLGPAVAHLPQKISRQKQVGADEHHQQNGFGPAPFHGLSLLHRCIAEIGGELALLESIAALKPHRIAPLHGRSGQGIGQQGFFPCLGQGQQAHLHGDQ